MESTYREVQGLLVETIEGFDGLRDFTSDTWARPGGGGGVTMILSDGRHIEKAAVNFSAVFGERPEGLSERMAATGDRFYATGVSIIVHPRNPYAPTLHANIRYFEIDGSTAWFGGGADLTPYYLFEEDAAHFHGVLAGVCSRHTIARHEEWKQACDEYFYLPHRAEARGVGGLFFDHLTEDLEAVQAFQEDLARHLPDAYVPILERRASLPFGEWESLWHRIRRGRHVEFNLIWDRGTRFGVETGGRTESILASLPPSAEWHYDHHPAPGSDEAELLAMVRGPARSWI